MNKQFRFYVNSRPGGYPMAIYLQADARLEKCRPLFVYYGPDGAIIGKRVEGFLKIHRTKNAGYIMIRGRRLNLQFFTLIDDPGDLFPNDLQEY